MNRLNVAVCTLYANRKSHLQNLVRGLIASSAYPKQLVVVCMNDVLPELPATPFPVNTATIRTDNNCLPLAAARNKAASMATAEKLIFLDVDCISDRHLIEAFDYHLQQQDALYAGSVRYLHDGWRRGCVNFSKSLDSASLKDLANPLGQANGTLNLRARSSPHKLQGTVVTGKDRVPHPYELFWSLCFGIRKNTFDRIGGFDTDYIGYGAEDTDFSFTARSQNLPLYKVSALAYHQFHSSYDPPLNHLSEIVSNARVFYRKWNILPMKKWLIRFAELGYIKLDGDRIEIIKLPTEAEIAACIKNF